jgi:hypothetical protein
MDGSIFLVDSGNRLTELRRSAYDSEDLLQKLLADHPEMLRAAAGSKGKLLLVRREHGVPDDPSGLGRWSLDHLFIDAEGVPVLVEVKRASDTRIRREVVAQMLDYAANGVAHWSIESIVGSYRATKLSQERDADADLAAFLDNGDADSFWRQVQSNLSSGRIRMLFVADRIPKELRRIVEFLNEQMRFAEVLAIEVEQFLEPNGLRSLVPRLVGATARAEAIKSISAAPEPYVEDNWLASLRARHGSPAYDGAKLAMDWLRQIGARLEPQRSGQSVAAAIRRPDGASVWPFFVRGANATFEISLQNLVKAPAYEAESARAHLLGKIKALSATSLNASQLLTGWPSVKLEELLKEELWNELKLLGQEIKAAIEAKA